MDHDTSPEQQASSNTRTYAIALALLVGVLIIFGGFMASTQANADYICTRIVEDSGSCTNGAWGNWAVVGTQTDATTGDQTVTEQRVYTGTRVIRHIIQYISRRTTCAAGYAQQQTGGGGGASGFRSGSIVTESQVCQIQEQRTSFVDGSTGGRQTGDAIVIDDGTGAGAGGAGGAGGGTTRTTTTIGSLAEILAFRRANIDLGLSVVPAIVSPGQTAQVRWTTVEMVGCRVTADRNADMWGATDLDQQDLASIAGDHTSSPITQTTTYTLSCIDFEGNPHQETATVRIAPEWQEF